MLSQAAHKPSEEQPSGNTIVIVQGVDMGSKSQLNSNLGLSDLHPTENLWDVQGEKVPIREPHTAGL